MGITVYTTSNCGICHALMQWLDKQSIKYTKQVVDEDTNAMNDFLAVNEGMIGTPFTVIEDKGTTTKVAGFDQKKILEAIA